MTDKYDLPFDPGTGDFVCHRDPDGTLHFNITPAFRHHSPSGLEWGYGGSGPADFALNIIYYSLNLDKLVGYDAELIHLWDGTKIPNAVWDYHHDVKWQLIAKLPYEGGTITRQQIREVLKAQKDWPEGSLR